jgi:hypothetical protein
MFDFKRVETGSAERYPTRVKKHLDLYGTSASSLVVGGP